MIILLVSILSIASVFSFDSKPVDLIVTSAINNKVLPGGVLIVGQGEKILHRKAYGSGPQGKNSFDTIYDIASLTKVVATATSFMLLEERGKASITDKLSSYFPEFSGGDKDTITIEDLMRHRSGLPAGKDLIPGEGYADFIKRVLTGPLSYAPRTKVVYSDLSFILMAEVVKKITGQTMSEFTQENIFVPLKMSSTTYHVPETQTLQCALTMPNRQCRPHDPVAYNFFPTEVGHAGIFTTADDLLQIVRMYSQKGMSDNQPFMKAETIAKMTILPPGATRGLGWDLLSEYAPAPRGDIFPKGSSYGHTGYTGTTIWIDPLSNSFYLFLSNRVYLGDAQTKTKFSQIRKKLATSIANQIYTK